MAQVCRFYGTAQGCRHGRRCRDLHITHDGSAAVTRASPDAATRLRDSWRCRLHTALQSHLTAAGSATEIGGTSYTRDAGEPRIRFTVRGVRPPSDRTWEVIAQGGLELPDGSWLTPQGAIGAAETTYHGGLPVFFHGTTVERGLQVLQDGHVVSAPHHQPVGHYTCLHAHDFYVRGAIVECTDRSLVLSTAQTRALRGAGHLPQVPQGVIAVITRSAREYVHCPESTEILAVTFTLDTLAWALGMRGMPALPPYDPRRCAAAFPKSMAWRAPAPRTPPRPPRGAGAPLDDEEEEAWGPWRTASTEGRGGPFSGTGASGSS